MRGRRQGPEFVVTKPAMSTSKQGLYEFFTATFKEVQISPPNMLIRLTFRYCTFNILCFLFVYLYFKTPLLTLILYSLVYTK